MLAMGETFNRLHGLPVGLERQQMTAEYCTPLQQDGTGTTGGVVTDDLRASHPQLLPDDVGQRPSGLKLQAVQRPVDFEGNRADDLALSQRRGGCLNVIPYSREQRPCCSG